MMTLPRLILVVAGLGLLAPLGIAGHEAGGPPPAGLADLAWMAGRWLDTSEGNVSEEVWTAPSGDSMMGMWRFVAAGRARVFELLTIAPGESGLELRLRHFDPKLVGREERERPVVLKLVRSSDHEAMFEGPDNARGATVRITYHRMEDGLVVTLEKEGSKQDFRFRRGDPRTP